MNATEQIVTIPLTSIIEIDILPDRPLNAQHVESLVATNEPDKWQPIIVTPIGDKYGRIAGKHRIAAAKILQRNSLNGVIRTYATPQDMYTDSWEDNVKNGLPPTVKERKQYAVRLSRIDKSLSLREIGRRTGLPHQTVKAAIEEALKADEQNENISPELKRLFSLSDRMTKVCRTFIDFTGDADVEESASLLTETYLDDELEEMECILSDMRLIFNAAYKQVQKRRG